MVDSLIARCTGVCEILMLKTRIIYKDLWQLLRNEGKDFVSFSILVISVRSWYLNVKGTANTRSLKWLQLDVIKKWINILKTKK